MTSFRHLSSLKARGAGAFLRLEAELGRGEPRDGDRRIQELEQRLQDQTSQIKQFQQQAAPVASNEATGKAYALPEPDESINRRQIFRSLISPLRPGRMLDLGAGHGAFSLLAAELGWKVTAVDARTVRFPNAARQKNPERAALIRSVEWVHSDIREFPIQEGEYDLICVLGLMHHLEVEDHLKLLKSCSGTLTLLNARVAPEIVASEGPYEGSYYQERGGTREERDQIPLASWGNETSFRHTEESLLRLLRDCGYSKVMPMRPPHYQDYTFYLCLPAPAH